MMTKFKILGLLIFMSASGFAQSGYLGSLNAIGLNVNLVPMRFRTIKVEVDKGDSIRAAPLRYAEPSFSLSYSRVVSRKIELGVGYTFASIRTYTHKADYIYENGFDSDHFHVLKDVKARQHSFNFSFKFYRRGSLAPTGKYLGLSLNAGLMSTNENELIPARLGSSTGVNSIWMKQSEVDYVLEAQKINNTSGSYFSIRGIIGRNYPIGKNLMFNCFASFPLLSSYKNNRTSILGFRYYLDSDYSPRIKDDDFGEVVNLTMHLYNRVVLSMGIRYQF